VHSAERARHGYWLHQTRLDNPLFGNEPESRYGPGQSCGRYTKYRTFLPPAYPVEEALPAMVSLPSFHFPPKDVTRDLETKKSKNKTDREVDENRMIVPQVRLAETGSLIPLLALVISASPDASMPFGRPVRNNKCTCVGPVVEFSSSTWP
jgi:hypothetical protein